MQLRLEVVADPFSVSICNCLGCQRRTGNAVVIEGWESFQELANGESDFDPIRDELAFQELIGR